MCYTYLQTHRYSELIHLYPITVDFSHDSVMGQVQIDIGFKVTIIDTNLGDGHRDSPFYGCSYLKSCCRFNLFLNVGSVRWDLYHRVQDMHFPSALYQCNTGVIPVQYPVETEALSEMKERAMGSWQDERLRRGCGGEEQELGLQLRERGARREAEEERGGAGARAGRSHGAAEAGAVAAQVHPQGDAAADVRRELRGAVGHHGGAGRAVAGAALRLDQAAAVRGARRRPVGEPLPLWAFW